ncbi:MAG: ABC transporter ATP-binding protein [Planctomycetes bacterium]|nr:ABC transporter ATP-binding protein [Planctomycetota bacterium]
MAWQQVALTMTIQSILNIQQLSKKYAEHSVLRDLNLELHSSQRIAILGDSGCGKSTLLRIIAGLESPDSGSVVLQDPQKCQMVFQDLGLWPSHTAKQQLLMAAKASNFSEATAAADMLLQQLGIEHLADCKPATMSGGEARRLAFARVLICQPKLILLDEAFSSLDENNRVRGLDLLQELLSHTDAAVIMVTHNLADAQHLNLPVFDLIKGQLHAR